ncbi:C39 family peptidase [Micromonospora sp. WMMD1102]|uniref:C39 family peptidase n=1 Tax=Micromonospora sp. WMMD1102 TaxID=3016105 RepID=UPI0024153314|nr:C39 family peptidase [Micromonospora sp. WMMD1102]MDG4789110.1 C39 family peptidase [Micromonospora sp. WMMD1102]MDG4790641.1 C39 family peptidase [Micromonospora sp. WMMD1102]
MTNVKRWLPAITDTPIRKTALGIAGLAVVGGAFAAPAISTDTPPTGGNPTAAAVTNDIRDIDKRAPSKTLDYQYKAQENFYYCAPAATRIALSAQGQTPSQDDVAKRLGTTEAGTNSAEDTTRVLNTTGGKNYRTVAIPDSTAKPEQMDRLQVDIVNAIDAKRPVVMNIKGTATDVDGMSHSYPGGHYLTVVGYDDHGRKVKIADPANPDQAQYWMSTINLANWATERGYSA